MPEPLPGRVIRAQAWLDPVADVVQKLVGGIFRGLGGPGRVLKSLLNGTLILRHPLHPALTDVPVGAWTVGVAADVAAHFTHRIPEAAGDLALAVGLAVALLTLITGYTDFQDTYGLERRFATAHGLLMSLVFVVDAVSLGLRWWAGPGAHPLAVGLSIAAYAVLLLSSWIGGHVAFGLGYPVNRNAFVEGPSEWTPAGHRADVPAGGMRAVDAGGMRVLLARDGERICALSAICSHVGGPLDEGTLEDGVVSCPWHGSRFRLRDGRAVAGPATFDQPLLEVRELDGRIEVRLAQPLH